MNTKETEVKSSAIGAIIGTIVLAVASAVAGWIACEMWPKGTKGGFAMGPRANIAMVAVTNAEMRTYNLPERYVAHAEAMQEVDLLPQVDGYVKEIRFKEGDLIRENQVLYVLDDERYQAVANQRRADLAAAEAEERRASRYFERMTTADARGITQLERDNAEAAADKAKAAVLQAKANLVVAEYDVKRTKVYAPIAGKIGKSNAHIGDYVAPSKGALARIVQVDPIRVSFPVTDRSFVTWREQSKKGDLPAMRMRLILPDGSDYAQQGTWDFDDNEMSRETATVIMRLSFPNPDRLLIPNSYVTVLQDYQKPPQYLSIPQQCLIELQGGNQGVWIVRDDMTVEQRPVTVREMFEGWVPVLTGIKTGERIVLSGTGKLAPGMKVAFAVPTSNDDINPNYVPPIKD